MSDLGSDFQQALAMQRIKLLAQDAAVPIGEVARRIGILTSNLATFWSHADGWAPAVAAEMLSAARLDRVGSLAKSLSRWVDGAELSDGDLILAWTNLGGVLEGILKLFLSVYIVDYRSDSTALQSRAFHTRRQELRNPDGLTLDPIIHYVELAGLLCPAHIAFSKQVQSRRNAVHAFRDREIGDGHDFYSGLREARVLIRMLHGRMPYPSDCNAVSELRLT